MCKQPAAIPVALLTHPLPWSYFSNLVWRGLGGDTSSDSLTACWDNPRPKELLGSLPSWEFGPGTPNWFRLARSDIRASPWQFVMRGDGGTKDLRGRTLVLALATAQRGGAVRCGGQRPICLLVRSQGRGTPGAAHHRPVPDLGAACPGGWGLTPPAGSSPGDGVPQGVGRISRSRGWGGSEEL